MIEPIPTEAIEHCKARTDGVSSSESLCENPKIANRVPTGGKDRAPAMYSGPTSGSIRASLKGQVPTGPTFHTVWRVVGRLNPNLRLSHCC